MGKDKHTFKEIESNMRKVQAVRIEWLNYCKILSEMESHAKRLKKAMEPFCDKPIVGLTAANQPFMSFTSKTDGCFYTVHSAVEFFNLIRDIELLAEVNG